MKTNYFILFLVFLGLQANAQSLNPSFENWTTLQNTIFVSGTATIQGFTADYEIDDPQFTYNEIVNWSSLNQLTGTASLTYPAGSSLVELVSESSDASDGAKSVRLESTTVDITATVTATGFPPFPYTATNVAPGLLISGEFDLDEDAFADELLNSTNLNSLNPFTYDGTGQAIDFRPGTLSGMYKYTGVSGDSAMMVSGLIKDRVIVAYVMTKLPNASTWTAFDLEYTYLSCETPDTIISVFCSSNLDATFDNGNFMINSSYTGVDGSVLLIDALTMDTLNPSTFPPIAINDNSSIYTDQVDTMDVTMNDDFCGGVTPTPTVIQTGSGSGEIEYTPPAGFSGIDTVEYEVCNVSNICDTALWIIEVNAIALCDAQDDFRSLPVGGSSVFDATANDDDCGGTPSITVTPFNGVAGVESNGDISYSPLVGFVGTDSLTYTVCSTINPNQCTSAKVYYEVITGIKDVATYTINVSPNPATDYAKVVIDNNEITQLSVFNRLGKEILNTSFRNELRIDLKNYLSGVYLVQLENKFGKATRKIVVRK